MVQKMTIASYATQARN